MAEDKLTAQICNKHERFISFDTGQANFGRHGYSVDYWKTIDGTLSIGTLSNVSYSDISAYGDEFGNVNFYAEWKKNRYGISAVKIPEECGSGLSGFGQYEYLSFAEVSADNEDKNYKLTSWSFPDGQVSADNPMRFRVLSAVTLSAGFKDLRTLRMRVKSGRNAVWRYDQVSGYLDNGRKNVLSYKDLAGVVNGPFSADSDLNAPEFLVGLNVAEENMTAIGEKSFYECQNLRTVDCRFISSIEDSAFAGCEKLEFLQVSDLVLVGRSSFSGCSSLTSIQLPRALSISENAFLGCQGAISVYAPRLTDVLSGAFMNCSSLAVADFQRLSSIGSRAFDCGPAGSRLADLNCPSLKYADPSAFYNCGSLTSIDGVSGLTRVEDAVFAGCERLKTLTLLSADRIGQNALSGCRNLASLYAYSVSAIEASAFCGCGGLKRIDFGYTLSVVPSLVSTAFDGLSNIVCYVPKDKTLYENWISDVDWQAVIRNNDLYIFQHEQAVPAAQQE